MDMILIKINSLISHMNKQHLHSIITLLFIFNFIFSSNFEKELQTQLIMVESGGNVKIPEAISGLIGE